MGSTEEFDSRLDAPERELIGRAREFAAERVAPDAAGWDAARRYPLAAIREACARGLAYADGTTEMMNERIGVFLTR